MANYCTKCGAALEGEVKFCTKCGAPVTPPPQNNAGWTGLPVDPYESGRQPHREEDDSAKKILVLLLSVILGLLVFGGIGYYLYTQIMDPLKIAPESSSHKSNPVDSKDKTDAAKKDAAIKDKQQEKKEAAPQVVEDKPNWHWIQDTTTGVWLWNPEPTEGEWIVWSGDYVTDGNYRYANGPGVLTWYKNGKVIQVDNGSFERGRHHGRFTHKFPSGKVKYSNWSHGREL
ncbi:MAG: zinc ribbon domain-containing protein [Selenomonas sp.]|uniref:zinc ribbon domain-containing protein n=1 Tax=Selenomonas sp. TaxID=2053611 RepID=UPI0025EE27CD|nr:zinc ribbon domain-containing protein [Selenomonas sp.]MCR5438370.1 zinc ribbon domain-containing protein [Selenomonas sp.]